MMKESKPVSSSLRPFAQLADFLCEILGPDTKMVLQNAKDVSHPMVAIASGHLSGRTIRQSRHRPVPAHLTEP